jgi:hypothetical protein
MRARFLFAKWKLQRQNAAPDCNVARTTFGATGVVACRDDVRGAATCD